MTLVPDETPDTLGAPAGERLLARVAKLALVETFPELFGDLTADELGELTVGEMLEHRDEWLMNGTGIPSAEAPWSLGYGALWGQRPWYRPVFPMKR
jgi:hypothetical protein